MSRIIHFLRRVVQAVSDAFATLLIALVRVYQHTLGGVLGGHCRFEPTCSNYAIGAIRNCGPVKGLFLATWRILRCNPWGGSGYDPPPEPKRPGPGDATPCGGGK